MPDVTGDWSRSNDAPVRDPENGYLAQEGFIEQANRLVERLNQRVTGRIFFSTVNRVPMGVIMTEPRPELIPNSDRLEQRVEVRMFGAENQYQDLHFRDANLGTEPEINNAMSIGDYREQVSVAHRIIEERRSMQINSAVNTILNAQPWQSLDTRANFARRMYEQHGATWDGRILSVQDAWIAQGSGYRYLVMDEIGRLRAVPDQTSIEIVEFNQDIYTLSCLVRTPTAETRTVEFRIPSESETLMETEPVNYGRLLQIAKDMLIPWINRHLLGGVFAPTDQAGRDTLFFPAAIDGITRFETVYTLSVYPTEWFPSFFAVTVMEIVNRIEEMWGVPVIRQLDGSIPGNYRSAYDVISAGNVVYPPFLDDRGFRNGVYTYNRENRQWMLYEASTGWMPMASPYATLIANLNEHLQSRPSNVIVGQFSLNPNPQEISLMIGGRAINAAYLDGLETRIAKLESALAAFLVDKEKITEETRMIHV